MDGPILGTYIAEFRGDTSQLTPALANVEAQSKKTVTEVENRIASSTAAVAKLNKSYEETGLATDRNLKKLVAQQLALRESIVATYGSLSAATPQAQAQYAALSASIQQATIRTRELNHEFALQRMLSSPAGAPRTLEGAAELGLAQAGMGSLAMKIPQAAVAAALAYEEMKLIGDIGEKMGTEWKQWADVAIAAAGRVGKKVKEVNLDLMLGAIDDQSVMDQENAALKGAKFSANGSVPRYAKLRYTVNPNQYDQAAGPDSSGFLKQMQIQDAIDGLKLQEATLTGNTKAMAALNAELDRNKIRELEASGYTTAQAQAYVAQEEKLRKLTDTLKVFTQSSTRITGANGVTYGGITADMMTPQSAIDAAYSKIAYAFNNEDQVDQLVSPIEAALKRLEDDYDENAKHYKKSMSDAVYSVENLFTGVLEAGMHGNLHNIGAAFHSFLDGIEHDIASFIAHQAVKQLLALLGNYLAGSSESALGGAFAGNVTGSIISGMANGGILAGGFRAFASGGVVTSPTFGLVGEGKYNEAVIPLPDGRHVEAKVAGQQQSVMHQTIYLVQEPPPDVSDGRIITVVQAAMLRNGPLRKTVIQTVK